MAEVNTKLLASWSQRGPYGSDAKNYRLVEIRVAYAKSSTYIVERDEKGTLGEPKWVGIHDWKSDDHNPQSVALNALVGLAETLQKQITNLSGDDL